MHELSLAQGLLARALELAAQQQAVAVRRIVLRVGELAGVETRQLTSAFEAVREGTLCAAATLDITAVEALWSCPNCGTAIARGAPLRCTDCGAAARLGLDCDALLIERIDLEVRGV